MRQSPGAVPVGVASLSWREDEAFTGQKFSQGSTGAAHVPWAGECISNRSLWKWINAGNGLTGLRTLNGLMWLECGPQASGNMWRGRWDWNPEKDGGRVITGWGQLFGALEPMMGIKVDWGMLRFMILKNHLSSRAESEGDGLRLKRQEGKSRNKWKDPAKKSYREADTIKTPALVAGFSSWCHGNWNRDSQERASLRRWRGHGFAQREAEKACWIIHIFGVVSLAKSRHVSSFWWRRS